jgi:hypothetical protein
MTDLIKFKSKFILPQGVACCLLVSLIELSWKVFIYVFVFLIIILVIAHKNIYFQEVDVYVSAFCLAWFFMSSVEPHSGIRCHVGHAST